MVNGIDALSARDLAAFAVANGWTYEAEAEPPALSGDLWEQATAGAVRDRIVGPGWETGHLVGASRTASETREYGGITVRRSVSYSTSARSVNVGYFALRLPRCLPNIVLDGRSNDGLVSSLQHPPRRSQRLSLEGDFDTHFHLYAPRGYERDALYVFTPDLMALLVDETGDLDVEIRDDLLIVYRPGGFDLFAPATWTRFERLRATVGAKAWTQSDGYTDDRAVGVVGGPVAEGGRRLRRRLPGVFVGAMVFAGIGVVAGLGGAAVALFAVLR